MNTIWGFVLIFCILILPRPAWLQPKAYEPEELLDFCLDAQYHKTKPGPEDVLHHQCSPWKNRSCCDIDTSVRAHYDGLYKFDYDHCSKVTKVGTMSAQCKKHFVQDLCFYECSPNVGPWMVTVEQKFRRQRFMNVPLCLSDCNAWFQDCANEFTCTANWPRNFDWKDGVNTCPRGSTCRTFRQIFETPENFCEQVWDHSWKVVNDSEHCMRLWFNPVQGNPNDAVAKWKVETIARNRLHHSGQSSAVASVIFSHSITNLLLVAFLGQVFSYWRNN